MKDMKFEDNTILSQVSQIKHRSESLNMLPKKHRGFSNVLSVNESWSNLVLTDKLLTGANRLIAEDILDMMQRYQSIREKKLNLAEKRQWFKQNWSSILVQLKTKFNDDTVVKFEDLQNQSSLNNASTTQEVDLSAVKTACERGDAKFCLCKDLVWYKGWWNSLKGLFGSKATNCAKATKRIFDNMGVELSAKAAKVVANTCKSGVVAKCLCDDLAFYNKWWNSLKGLFGSKATNCNPKLNAKKFINLSALTACKDGDV